MEKLHWFYSFIRNLAELNTNDFKIKDVAIVFVNREKGESSKFKINFRVFIRYI